MARAIELRRHTDDDDDELSEEGVTAALALGPRVEGGYHLLCPLVRSARPRRSPAWRG